jgi:hypothetical protein
MEKESRERVFLSELQGIAFGNRGPPRGLLRNAGNNSKRADGRLDSYL